MNPILPVIATFIIAVLTVAANAIVSTTIRFAPDKRSATQDLKRLGGTVLRWFLNIAMAVNVLVLALSSFGFLLRFHCTCRGCICGAMAKAGKNPENFSPAVLEYQVKGIERQKPRLDSEYRDTKPRPSGGPIP